MRARENTSHGKDMITANIVVIIILLLMKL